MAQHSLPVELDVHAERLPLEARHYLVRFVEEVGRQHRRKAHKHLRQRRKRAAAAAEEEEAAGHGNGGTSAEPEMAGGFCMLDRDRRQLGATNNPR